MIDMKQFFQNQFIKAIVLVLSLVLLMIPSVSAASGDVLLSFSTKGPDCYADGSSVLEGELYALVWIRNGCTFSGIDMNGQAVNLDDNAVVAAVPRAQYSRRHGGMRCPRTVFQLRASAQAAYAGGSFALAVLDTRVSDGKGGFVPSGRLSDVKGWGLIENSTVKSVSSGCAMVSNAGGERGGATTTASAVPAGEEIPQPRITGIKVENGYVRLTVKGTSARVLYNVAAGATPDRPRNRHAASVPAQGHVRADQEIEMLVPIQDGQRFFQVIRN